MGREEVTVMCGAAGITLNTEQAGIAFEYFQVLDCCALPCWLVSAQFRKRLEIEAEEVFGCARQHVAQEGVRVAAQVSLHRRLSWYNACLALATYYDAVRRVKYKLGECSLSVSIHPFISVTST